MILPMFERLVCSNGMVMPVKGIISSYSIHHNRPLVEQFSSLIEKTLKGMIDSCPKLQAIVEGCIADSVEWDIAVRLIKALVGREKHIEGIKSKLVGKSVVTRWDIYNAITDYATHGEQLKPNVEHWLQTKAQKVMTTKLEAMPLAEVQ